jgi:hypothetical protein
MVRLSDLSEHEQAHLLAKTLPPMTPRPVGVSQQTVEPNAGGPDYYRRAALSG